MKIKDLVKEISFNKSFIEFMNNHSDAYFSAAFFSSDFDGQSKQISLDFFIPSENKIAVLESPFYDVVIHEDEIIGMKEQATQLKIDADEVLGFCRDILQNFEGFNPARMIAVLKEDIWNITVMNNTLGIIKIKLNAVSGEKISANKGSFMDFAR
jgi:hypothetical protein